jgi:hypothetical protein
VNAVQVLLQTTDLGLMLYFEQTQFELMLLMPFEHLEFLLIQVSF